MNTPDDAIEPIAIIGASGRLWGHWSIDAFWGAATSDEAAASRTSDGEDVSDASYFDADALGLSAREAQVVGPAQRVCLECAWELFENAAYDPSRFDGRVGIFVSVAGDDSRQDRLPPPLRRSFDELELELLTSPQLTPLWVSRRLSLTGPCICLGGEACASTAAVHLACHSLRVRECEIAIAGGVGILRRSGIEGGSRESGREWRAGLVLLKASSSARADRDAVRAIIRGSALGRAGSERGDRGAGSLADAAPTAAECLRRSGVEPSTVSYIELTDTPVEQGDARRVASLVREVFGSSTSPQRRRFVRMPPRASEDMGTVKGVAGVVKIAKALEHRVVPGSPEGSSSTMEPEPFVPPAGSAPWLAAGSPRRAALIDLGPAGASAQVVLEEAPETVGSGAARSSYPLRISAKSLAAVEMTSARLRDYLREHPDVGIGDVAYSLDTGRRSFGYRKAMVCRSVADALECLGDEGHHKVDSGFAASAKVPVVFMFPGAGAHHAGMGRGLYEAEPIFRDAFDSCRDVVASQNGIDLRSAVYPDDPEAALDQPAHILAGLFSLEYSLARLWMELGVQPESMIGHSLGEYVAACLSGVFTLENALRLVTFRGRLFETLPAGGMLSVSLGESEIAPYLKGDLSLAGINAPKACVVSGSKEAVEDLQRALSTRDVDTRLLPVGRAGHSRFVEPILDEFTSFVRALRLNRPKIPYLSNYTGTWTRDEDAMDPAYWAAHLRHTVRFSQGLDTLLLAADRVFLEVGPGRSLSTLARRHPSSRERLIVSSMRHVKDSQPDVEVFQRALGKLWTAGVSIDSDALYRDERRRRLPLPTYPFERKRHQVEAGASLEETKSPPGPRLDPDRVEPRNEIEKAIARIWGEVLGVEDVGVEASFGDAGGDEGSLRRMTDRMTREFGVVTDKRWSLESTIAQLSDLVSERALAEMPADELARALADLDLEP